MNFYCVEYSVCCPKMQLVSEAECPIMESLGV